MRRNQAVQTGGSENIRIDYDLANFICPVTQLVFFDPVVTADCEHYVERTASVKLKKCPCCNALNPQFKEVSRFFKTTLQDAITQNNLYEKVYFDRDTFENTNKKNELYHTSTGQRFLMLLQHSEEYLNEIPVIRTEEQTTHPFDLTIPEYHIHTSSGKSAIEILASTLEGRDLLRKKLRIDVSSGKFFFGFAEIFTESLQIQINGKSIQEWLSISTAMEVMQDEEQQERQALFADAQTTTRQMHFDFQRMLRSQSLFRAGAASLAGSRVVCSATVNPILQNVVYGNEAEVKAALELVKNDDPTQLNMLLSMTGHVKDYSDRTITNLTLLQAAACAGDIDMCLMLETYLSPEEFAIQLAEIFPEGIEAHEANQQRNVFDFNPIYTAIKDTYHRDLYPALQHTDNDSPLYHALNEFRCQFTEISHREKIFNPQHLLRIVEMYVVHFSQCERDLDDRRDLFWRQIVGYVQRFMPACYAQACAQGLADFVKMNHDSASWRPKPFDRTVKLKYSPLPYFPLDVDPRTRLGFDFAFSLSAGQAIYVERSGNGSVFSFAGLKNFVEQKQQAFRTLYARVQSHPGLTIV